MQHFKGKFQGIVCDQPMSGIRGLAIKTNKGERIFWGDWRPIEQLAEVLEKDQEIEILYKAEWDWAVRLDND